MFIALLVLLASVGIATAGPDAAAPSADAPGATAPTAAEAPRIAGSDDGVVEVDWRNQPPRIHNANLFAKSIEGALGALTYYGAYDNPVERARVGRITYELAQQSRYRDFPMSIFLIDMPVPNAFALPGGHLFITRGMLDLGLTDDMLACLIGHEIAHVTERHGVRLQRRATLLNLLSQALLVGVLLGVDDEPENPYDPIESRRSRKGDLVQGTAAAGMVFSELLMRSHSRDFEDAADLEGQRLAAAAGYDPRGAQQLWDLMQKRVPQSESYGYWRTHPFSSDRLRAAGARADELTIQPPRPADDFRAMSQQVILSYKDALPPSLLRMVLPPPRDQRTERTPDQRVPQPRRPGQVDPRAQLDEQARRAAVRARVEAFLDRAALTAWPKGPTADRLRLARLERLTRGTRALPPLERDYGRLIRAHRAELEDVRRLAPESAAIARIEQAIAQLRDEVDARFAEAQAVWRGEIYETRFLETFLSNHPTADEAPDVALALGNAYSRLGRQSDAVRFYLRAAEAGASHPSGQRALRGLQVLTPRLEALSALQQLATGSALDDADLRQSAVARLTTQVDAFTALENGAEYLERYPDGEHAEAVRARLDDLADRLYGEIVLYRGVGDSVKALERIQKILTYAPRSAAAQRLQDEAVLDS